MTNEIAEIQEELVEQRRAIERICEQLGLDTQNIWKSVPLYAIEEIVDAKPKAKSKLPSIVHDKKEKEG